METVGLIAGWGDYPVTIAKRLHARGVRVVCVGVHGHADSQALIPYCDHYRAFGMAKLGWQARFLRRHGATQATMAGKIFKTKLFERFAWFRHLPDFAFTRHFYRQFITNSADRKDDTMLLTAIGLFNSFGIDFVPATDFAPELLVKTGNLTDHQPSRKQLADIEFGWQLAKQMGGLDVGQTVVVKGKAVLAVEAVEGTDECIRRAGTLCTAGGFTVVKVAKPNQDMRFDVPTVGLGTLQTIKQAGGSVLAIEAQRTIILDEPEVLQFARENRIAIVAYQQQPQTMTRNAA